MTSNRDFQVRRATAVSAGEDPERLLRRFRQNVSSNRQTGREGTDAEERAALPARGKKERNVPFSVFADQIAPEEQSTDTETAAVAYGTSAQLFVRGTVVRHFGTCQEGIEQVGTRKATASRKGVNNLVWTALGTLVLHSIRMFLTSPVIMRQILDAVVDNPGFITSVVAFVRTKQRKLAAEQAKVDGRCRQFEEAGIKEDTRSASVVSEESNRPPTDISVYKTNPPAYTI